MYIILDVIFLLTATTAALALAWSWLSRRGLLLYAFAVTSPLNFLGTTWLLLPTFSDKLGAAVFTALAVSIVLLLVQLFIGFTAEKLEGK